MRIAALAVVDAGRHESVQRIKHGQTNESWLVRTARDSYVVRLSNTSEESLQIDRQSEALVLETVANAAIGPEVVRCDPASHILITRYAGRTWTPAEAFAPANIDRVADLLWQLHGLRPPPGIHVVDLQSVVRGYLQTLDERGASGMAGTNEFRQRAIARLQLLPPHDPQFRRNRERVVRDAEREHLILEWDLGYDEES